MEPAAPSRTRWASEKPLADWRGAPHRLFPQRAPKPDAKAPASPNQGAVQPGMRLGLGRGAPGEAERRRGRGIRGRWEGEGSCRASRAGAQHNAFSAAASPSSPSHPGLRPPAGCSPKRRGCSGPGRLPAAASPPLPPCAPRPGREVSGFSRPSPASLLPPAARGPRARSKAE